METISPAVALLPITIQQLCVWCFDQVVNFVPFTASVVKLRALSEEPDAGRLMTSDQEGKDLAEPEEQQEQEERKREIPLLVKYFSSRI